MHWGLFKALAAICRGLGRLSANPDIGRGRGRRIGDSEFQMFAERAREMLCIVDAEVRFVCANPAWMRVLGWRPSDLVGTVYLDMVHPDDVQDTLDVATTLSDVGDVVGFVNRYRDRSIAPPGCRRSRCRRRSPGIPG